MERELISRVSADAIPRWKNTGAVCAKTRRQPLSRTVLKLRRLGEVNRAERSLSRLPMPSTATQPSGVTASGGHEGAKDDGAIALAMPPVSLSFVFVFRFSLLLFAVTPQRVTMEPPLLLLLPRRRTGRRLDAV
jgi:hypothetical protein